MKKERRKRKEMKRRKGKGREREGEGGKRESGGGEKKRVALFSLSIPFLWLFRNESKFITQKKFNSREKK